MNHSATKKRRRLSPPTLGLYIHIPWCIRKCPYCDFNSHEQKDALPIAEYCDALSRDLAQQLHYVQGREINSIFFGGGTPSLFPADAIGQIIENANNQLSFSPNIEITLECNPGTAEYSNFTELLNAGVNRLSIGAQSFDNSQLKRLGRVHAADEIRVAVRKAQSAGLTNLNLDLMHGLPNQSLSSALDDLKAAIDLNPTHISWYQLTIEPNTAFYSDPPSLPKEDDQAEIYHYGLELLKSADFHQYEISAYAKEGKQSEHNLNYWQFGDYLAIGAGAHGKCTQLSEQCVIRYQQTRNPKDYLDSDKEFTAKQNQVPDDELILEFMMNALRLNDGVDWAVFDARTGFNKNDIEGPLAQLLRAELMYPNAQRLGLNDRGRRYLNYALSCF